MSPVNYRIGYLVAILSGLSACGINVRHSGTATVRHVVTVDTEGLTAFFTDLCATDAALPDAEAIRTCALDKVGKFIDFVEGDVKP